MSTGTIIIQDALKRIGAHSLLSPAPPEAIESGLNALNTMIEEWIDIGIQIGVVPLSVAGDDLNEPPAARLAIVNNLAIAVAPEFDSGKVIVSDTLARRARAGYLQTKKMYQSLTIPDKVVSSTLPVGQGNSRAANSRTFFQEGETIDN